MPTKKFDQGKKQVLMQMFAYYLGLQAEEQHNRMMKMIECMSEQSLQKCFDAMKLDLTVIFKQQKDRLDQQLKIME